MPQRHEPSWAFEFSLAWPQEQVQERAVWIFTGPSRSMALDAWRTEMTSYADDLGYREPFDVPLRTLKTGTTLVRPFAWTTARPRGAFNDPGDPSPSDEDCGLGKSAASLFPPSIVAQQTGHPQGVHLTCAVTLYPADEGQRLQSSPPGIQLYFPMSTPEFGDDLRDVDAATDTAIEEVSASLTLGAQRLVADGPYRYYDRRVPLSTHHELFSQCTPGKSGDAPHGEWGSDTSGDVHIETVTPAGPLG